MKGYTGKQNGGIVATEPRSQPTGWICVPDPLQPDVLLFKYDAQRQLIEIQRRGVKRVIDLTQVGK